MIYAKDIEAMAAFYGGVLGLTPIDEARTESWVEFEAGPLRFALHAIPAHIAEQIEIASPPVPREDEPVKLSFEVDDLEVELSRLRSLDVTVLHRPWGGCDGVDPEGNVFGIVARERE
jgi:catechol 2,3-dioxygenase-like lactoylglutathione lyase family enzyme